MVPALHAVVLMTYDWFSALPEAIQADVRAHARKCVLAPGERLFSRGDKPDGMYGVLEGSVRVSGISPEGREIILDFYGPGSWFGEVSALNGLSRGHDAEAYVPTTLLHVSADDLEQLVATHSAFSRALLRLEAQRLHVLLAALEQYSVQSIEQRLASRLLMLAGPYGVSSAQGLKIELHLPQETLAQLVGVTRQRINQILKDWQHEGLIDHQYGQVTLLDEARFEKLSQ